MTARGTSLLGFLRRRSRWVLTVASVLLLVAVVSIVATDEDDDGIVAGPTESTTSEQPSEADDTDSPSPGESETATQRPAEPDVVRVVEALPGLYPAGHESAAWLDSHPTSDLATCTVCHAPSTCADCHGTELPHPDVWAATHGKATLTGQIDCATCHTDLEQDCTSCHGLEMPHDDEWVDGHQDVARPDPAACATCHLDSDDGSSDCASCHRLDRETSCATCHTDQVDAIALELGHAPEQCLTCHEQRPGVPGPGVDHQVVPGCLTCHDPGELGEDSAVSAPRDWLRAIGEGKATWTPRAQHAPEDLASCASCHDVHDAAPRQFPPGVEASDLDCASTCHVATDGEVEVYGFVNESGDPEQTVYRGTISPVELLEASGTAHARLYENNGCAGVCHAGPHGTVTECKDCHLFAFDEPGANLHSTHVSFVGGEAANADPGNSAGKDPATASCQYCHPGEEEDLGRPSCWNCHLSGHDPITPFWEIYVGE